jgi:hypothetical protein
MKFLTIEHDPDTESPNEWGGWRLYSFSRRHNSFKDPDYFYEDGKPNAEIQALLEKGLAFPLSYFEHGNCQWSLMNEGYKCQFDSVSRAGMLVWEGKEEDLGASTVEDRAKHARSFCEVYTEWSNGETYWFKLENEQFEEGDACGGFIGMESVAEEIRSRVGKEDIKIKGDCADIAEYYKFTEGKQERATKVVSWR